MPKTVLNAKVSFHGSFEDMADNIFLSSRVPNRIDNYLFTGADSCACTWLHSLQAVCYVYQNDSGDSSPSLHRILEFNTIVNSRVHITLEALTLGCTVLFSAVEVSIAQNQFHFFNCSDCDMEMMSDGGLLNSGFALMKRFT